MFTFIGLHVFYSLLLQVACGCDADAFDILAGRTQAEMATDSPSVIDGSCKYTSSTSCSAVGLEVPERSSSGLRKQAVPSFSRQGRASGSVGCEAQLDEDGSAELSETAQTAAATCGATSKAPGTSSPEATVASVG